MKPQAAEAAALSLEFQALVALPGNVEREARLRAIERLADSYRELGPTGKRNGMFKHGLYTKEAEERRLLRELLRQSRRTLTT